MSAALDPQHAAALSQDCRNEELLPNLESASIPDFKMTTPTINDVSEEASPVFI